MFDNVAVCFPFISIVSIQSPIDFFRCNTRSLLFIVDKTVVNCIGVKARFAIQAQRVNWLLLLLLVVVQLLQLCSNQMNLAFCN